MSPGMRVDFEIASVRKILKKRDLWAPHSESRRRQDLIPRDAALPEKMGLKPGTKVLFFAGAAGDWANALAERGVEVHYSDASKAMVEYAKRRFPGTKIRSFRSGDAIRWPEKIRYDRVVSFEPIPLEASSLPIALLRAIAHSGGATLAYYREGGSVELAMKALSKIYGAGFRHEAKSVAGAWLSDDVRMASNYVDFYHLDAPGAEGRRLAEIDLKVLAALGDRKDVSLAALAKKPEVAPYGLGEKELLGSLRRLARVSEHVDSPLRNTIAVTAEKFHKDFVPTRYRGLANE